ncbi:MAG: hypothetical protein IPK64_02330 [bacterium]|nr:hypothetical protein [bacterium]
MTKRILQIVVVVGILATLVVDGIVHAAGNDARDLYAAQEFDKAIEACRGRTDHESVVVKALAYAERSALYKQKEDKKELTALAKSLKGTLGAKDLQMLAELGAISANPNGADLAADLMDDILDQVSSTADMDLVLETIKAGPGPKATASALKALHRHLSQVRKYVDAGGTMPDSERMLFTRADMLELLVTLLDGKETKSAAQKALVAIEEPALAALEAKGGAEAMDTARKIRDDMAGREKKHPGSAWYGKPD